MGQELTYGQRKTLNYKRNGKRTPVIKQIV